MSEIEVSFRAESVYGDVILSQNEQLEEDAQQIFLHRIVRESNGQELFLARTRWTYESLEK